MRVHWTVWALLSCVSAAALAWAVLAPADADRCFGWHDAYDRFLKIEDARAARRAIGDCTAAIEQGGERLALAYLGRGIAYRTIHEEAAALPDLEEAVRLAPDNLLALLTRGYAHRVLGNWSIAEAAFTRVIELKPDEPRAWLNRGIVRSDMGDQHGAIADYTEALRLKSDYAYAYNNRALAHERLGDYEAAAADLDRAAELMPWHGPVWFNRAEMFERAGADDKALTYYGHAIEVWPGYADAYYARGRILARRGDHRGAAAEFDRAVELEPAYPNYRLVRAQARDRLGDQAGALADYEAVLKVRPNDALALLQVDVLRRRIEGEPAPTGGLAAFTPAGDDAAFRHGEALMREKRYAEAEAVFDGLVAADATRPYYFRGRAAARARLNRLDEALSDYNAAIALAPDSAPLYMHRRTVLHRLRQWDAALADVEKAVALEPDFVGAREIRAMYYAGRGRLDEALADLDRAIELVPDQYSMRGQRGRLLARMRQADRAMADFDAGLQLAPGDIQLLLDRALLKAEQGELEAALDDLDEVTRLIDERRRFYGESAAAEAIRPMLTRSAAFAMNRRYAEAIAEYDRILALYPQRLDILADRGRVNYIAGDFAAAAADFDQVAAGNQGDFDILVWRYLAQQHLGQDAHAALMAAPMAQRSAWRFWPLPAVAMLRGDLDEREVRALCEAAPSEDTRALGQRAEACFYLGSHRLLAGEPDAGRALLQAAVAVALPGSAAYAAARAELDWLN